jgi:hypothetical protein
MALSLESFGKVWQKARPELKNPGIFYALKALRLHLAANKGAPDLQFGIITGTSADDSGGQVVIDAACKVYAVYGKKTATATDSYLVIFDDATDDAGAGTDGRVVLPFLAASDEQLYINPNGLDMGTGVVAKAYTDFDGTTDTTAGDAPNGFVIVGAP